LPIKDIIVSDHVSTSRIHFRYLRVLDRILGDFGPPSGDPDLAQKVHFGVYRANGGVCYRST
jgi:hypothetical protein